MANHHKHYVALRRAHGPISPIYGFTDADWASDQTDRRSMSGYQFFFKGSIISWASKKQTFVATSTMESEYVAASHGCKEAIWLRSLVNEINTKAELGLNGLSGNFEDSFAKDRMHLEKDSDIIERFEGQRLKPITIFSDSQACIRVAYNPENHKHAKHIDIRYHFLRQRVRMGYVRMAFVNSEDNVTDYLTKVLQPAKFKGCRESSGVDVVA